MRQSIDSSASSGVERPGRSQALAAEGSGSNRPASSPRLSEAERSTRPSRLLLALALLLATFVTTTTFGAGFYLSTRTDVVTNLVPDIALILLGRPAEFIALISYIFRSVWSDRQLLEIGLSFSLPTLAILLSHELGHYFACRRNNLPCTLPYFIPAPLLVGTFGAFIRIRAPIRTRRQLLEVGAAGPIAGFLVLLPFLVFGIAHSQPVSIVELDADVAGGVLLLELGNSPLMWLATLIFHGRLAGDTLLNLHPFALAGWLGTFVTAINLIPVGQLDGGHILFAAIGRRQALVSWCLLGALAVMGYFYWPGWWLWCVVLLVIGPRHPPVVAGRQSLDRRGRLIALAGLIIFGLTFMPAPFELAPILP